MTESPDVWVPPAQAIRQPKRRSNMKFVAAGLVLAAALAYLIFSGVQAQGMYYLTVSEALAGGTTTNQVRVAGYVVPGTIEQDPKTLEASFVIADEGAELPVIYKGVLPDAFVPEASVIVEGRYVSGQPFEAKQIMTQCPSKYEAAVAPEQ